MNKISIFLSISIFSISAHAELIDHGLYVTDTTGNVDYIKGENYNNLNYDQLIEQDSLGYINEGWTLASQEATNILYESYSFDDLTLIFDTSTHYIVTNNDLNDGLDLYYGPFYKLYADQITPEGYIQKDAVVSPVSSDGFYMTLLSRPTEVPIAPASLLFISSLTGLFLTKLKLS